MEVKESGASPSNILFDGHNLQVSKSGDNSVEEPTSGTGPAGPAGPIFVFTLDDT